MIAKKIDDNQKLIVTQEKNLHQQVVDYLKYQYPNVLFRTDFAAGIKMTIGQAVKHKKLQKCKSWPDLFIAEPVGEMKGLFLELKKHYNEVYLLKGQIRKDVHINEQAALLNDLRNKGYMAEFGLGFEHTKFLIDNYLRD